MLQSAYPSGRADARWAVGDSTVVSLELLTVLGAGPLCWYLLYQLIKGDRARHYWLIVLSTAELYGGFMTFCPEWITGNQNLHTGNWLHFWVYLMFFNLIWVFIPLWIMYDSYGYIVHSLRDPAGYAAELTRTETVAKLKPRKSPTKKVQ
ncbi:BZ3500_MvSof-1268-A1-R1_Chr8-2g10236 [Microbotryum saponariae]|uniref:BZ3500_MvSof-1268-A1-R1_Chr8-2g10236 protein n=1 Tax=Microbotryum saponariae TaxID=289078 RepID=A0A2X0KU15_9BASI|nr:BZ3500_MvSof-1268-A1-R1_Chr8-2g10236 [Microbotryum saponariae]SDA02034.1 BZ3501_MvSof-1269-A2-R1_Chr8-2g09986 [Microbotryum saponariae]